MRDLRRVDAGCQLAEGNLLAVAPDPVLSGNADGAADVHGHSRRIDDALAGDGDKRKTDASGRGDGHRRAGVGVHLDHR
jgi:hypothetical protein